MYISNLIKKFLSLFGKKDSISIDVNTLPSQGLFYDEGFSFSIRKATMELIADYESDYNPEDLGVVLSKLKKIVIECIDLPKGYTFNNIKSIDVVYIFLEIVKLTKGMSITMEYYDDNNAKIDKVNFDSKNFNYFKISKELMSKWIPKERCFLIDGYKFTLPSIGIENSLTNFLISKSYDVDALKYNDYSYTFTYFLGNKDSVTFDEIDNLIEIFNSDLDQDEINKIEAIAATFYPMQRYSLIKNGKIIEMNSKINLQEIWR
jgi:hypothetical protein